MFNFIKINLIVGTLFILASCATSMLPAQVNSTLPTYTKSEYIPQIQAEKVIQTNRCKYLIKGRTYIAPMGLNVEGDLKNGAKGIDEWVELDGGNAYVLIGYNWLTIDHLGSTQLHLEFDTMLCD